MSDVVKRCDRRQARSTHQGQGCEQHTALKPAPVYVPKGGSLQLALYHPAAQGSALRVTCRLVAGCKACDPCLCAGAIGRRAANDKGQLRGHTNLQYGVVACRGADMFLIGCAVCAVECTPASRPCGDRRGSSWHPWSAARTTAPIDLPRVSIPAAQSKMCHVVVDRRVAVWSSGPFGSQVRRRMGHAGCSAERHAAPLRPAARHLGRPHPR